MVITVYSGDSWWLVVIHGDSPGHLMKFTRGFLRKTSGFFSPPLEPSEAPTPQRGTVGRILYGLWFLLEKKWEKIQHKMFKEIYIQSTWIYFKVFFLKYCYKVASCFQFEKYSISFLEISNMIPGAFFPFPSHKTTPTFPGCPLLIKKTSSSAHRSRVRGGQPNSHMKGCN